MFMNLLYRKDFSERIEVSLTVMEADGDESIQDFVAHIQRELFKMIRLPIFQTCRSCTVPIGDRIQYQSSVNSNIKFFI